MLQYNAIPLPPKGSGFPFWFIMKNNVTINYSEYGNNPIAQEIEFELIKDVVLKLKYEENDRAVIISMADMITANTELEGKLDYEKINILIKVLSQLRNQIKERLK